MAHITKKPVITTTAYSIATTEEEPNLAPIDRNGSVNALQVRKPRRHARRTWRSTMLLQAFSLLWLCPAIAILTLNFKGHIIGASAWCPRGRCWVEAYGNVSSVPLQRKATFDRSDHNLLGMLQVVVKLLELWFVFIAAGLMYLMVMRQAGKNCGIPLRYITLPVEFVDPTRVFNFSLWRSRNTGDQRGADPRLWVLAAMASVLCAICTLMGPGTAVLIIPSLQWIPMDKVENVWFDGFQTLNQPIVGNWAFNDTDCTKKDFTDLTYSCTSNKWGVTLDAWVASTVASMAESSDGTLIARTTQQSDVFFYLNTTREFKAGKDGYTLLWVPSRQLTQAFSYDRSIIANISYGADADQLRVSEDIFESYAEYNKSLQMEVIRQGPILGASPNVNTGWWTIEAGANRTVICFPEYQLMYPIVDEAHNNFTKCIQEGDGWSKNVKSVSFLVEGRYTPLGDVISPSVAVTVTSSDRAVFLPDGLIGHDTKDYSNGTVGRFQAECLGGVSQDVGSHVATKRDDMECDWDFFFSRSFNRFSESNVTDYITTIRYLQTLNDSQASLVVDFVTYVNFTDYTLDPATISNPMQLVETPLLPKTGMPLPLDPAWYLAAMSLDYYNATLPSSRTTAQMLLIGMDALRTNVTDHMVDFTIALTAAVFMPIVQTLSLIDYGISDEPSREVVLQVLYRSARLQVWAYGFKSRTASFGLVIVVAGIIVVISQFILGLIDRREGKSLTQMLAAALAHIPDDKSPDDELMTLETRLRVVVDSIQPGKIRFEGS